MKADPDGPLERLRRIREAADLLLADLEAGRIGTAAARRRLARLRRAVQDAENSYGKPGGVS